MADKSWWVACDQWADAQPYTEEQAVTAAATLDADSTPCPGQHYYWQSEKPPTYNTQTHRVNIPKGARRA